MGPSSGYGHIEPPRPADTSHSGQWGLASLFMGSVVLVVVPLYLPLIFSVLNLVWHEPKFDSPGIKLVSIGSLAVVGGLLALGALGLVFGLIGLISGVARSQPVGLALGGILVCLVALVLAFILMLGIFRLRDELQKQLEQRGQAALFSACGFAMSLPRETASGANDRGSHPAEESS